MFAAANQAHSPLSRNQPRLQGSVLRGRAYHQAVPFSWNWSANAPTLDIDSLLQQPPLFQRAGQAKGNPRREFHRVAAQGGRKRLTR